MWSGPSVGTTELGCGKVLSCSINRIGLGCGKVLSCSINRIGHTKELLTLRELLAFLEAHIGVAHQHSQVSGVPYWLFRRGGIGSVLIYRSSTSTSLQPMAERIADHPRFEGWDDTSADVSNPLFNWLWTNYHVSTYWLRTEGSLDVCLHDKPNLLLHSTAIAKFSHNRTGTFEAERK
jgi:hypothetical protein